MGNVGSIPGSGRSSGGGHGNALQFSCLENLMDRGAWWATVHGVTESQIQLSDWNNKQQQQIPSFTYFARNAYLVMSTVRNSIYNHFPLIILLGDSHRHVSHYMHQILMLLVYYLASLAFLPCPPSFVAPISQPSAFCKSGATARCLQAVLPHPFPSLHSCA